MTPMAEHSSIRDLHNNDLRILMRCWDWVASLLEFADEKLNEMNSFLNQIVASEGRI